MSVSIHDVQLAQVFRTLFNYVRKNGKSTPPASKMGGIWSAEGVWHLGEITVMTSDGGYCESIRGPKVHAYMQFSGGDADNTVTLFDGERKDLVELAVTASLIVCGATDEEDDNDIQHTGD